MTEREQLIQDANELGLEFKGNISTAKLQEMVDNFSVDPEPVEEVAPPSPELAAGETSLVSGTPSEGDMKGSGSVMPRDPALAEKIRRAKKISESKKRALKTSIVTITNKDPRENSFTTTVALSFENQYFGLSKVIPLDVPVEVEQALIDNAESTMMTLHKDEIVDGKRTGNKRAVTVKKFAISYSKETAEE